MMARNRKRSPSLVIKWLVLMLALMNSVHGKAINSKKIKESPGEQRREDCPTHEDAKFPGSVRVPIHIIHTNPNNDMPQDVMNRSLSPWDYRINEDPNRLPNAIAEAHCHYNACVDATRKGLDHGLNSVPIQQEILVLRWKQTGCRQSYWLEKQIVTVGCTCAFPSILTSTSTNQGNNRQNNGGLTRTNNGLRQ